MPEPTIEINPQFAEALKVLETSSRPVFITGPAGTGKSTLLQHFRTHTHKQIAVLAPTGVAAVNVGGQTIHSFFKFKPDITPQRVADIRPSGEQLRLYKGLDSIVIDEVSMVRADLLDCVDRFLRLHGPERGRSFGGIQMVMIGDLYQLPPVVTSRDRDIFQGDGPYASPYFFDSQALQELPLKVIALSTIYRQSDEEFIRLLQAVRDNAVTPDDLAALNCRYQGSGDPGRDHPLTVTLTTTNDLADMVNDRQLAALPGIAETSHGVISGAFSERDLPTKASLDLKLGAQVMLVSNDPAGRWVNGTLATVLDIPKDFQTPDGHILVELSTGRQAKVSQVSWDMFRYFFNQEKGHVDTETVGSFRQYPLRLSWAVTIHKAQGKTFDRVVIDLGRGAFSHGQVYVALSRCRTLEGITLRQPIERRHISLDTRVRRFFERSQEPGGHNEWWEQDSLF